MHIIEEERKKTSDDLEIIDEELIKISTDVKNVKPAIDVEKNEPIDVSGKTAEDIKQKFDMAVLNHRKQIEYIDNTYGEGYKKFVDSLKIGNDEIKGRINDLNRVKKIIDDYDKTRKAYSYFEALVNRSSPENYNNMAELLQIIYVNYKA